MRSGDPNLLKLLGLRPTGDFGPYTIYTNKRHATVAFLRSPPLKPPSSQQAIQRARWRQTAQAWADLSDAQRIAWITAAKRAHLTITGHNLWFWYNLAGDDATVHTIERITGIPLITGIPA